MLTGYDSVRARLVSSLPGFDLAILDKLPKIAHAAPERERTRWSSFMLIPKACLSFLPRLARAALLVAVGWGASARAQSLDEIGVIRRFEHLRVEDGLSHPNVLSILQDRRGYLWFATFYGLNRYDGNSITTFYHDPLDETSLAESSISDLLEDHEGMLWIATWGGGLDRFDPRSENFTHLPREGRGGLEDSRVQSLFEDRDGTLWAGTFAGGLARFDRTRGTFTSFRHDPEETSSLSHDRIWDIAQDHDGRLWVGTENGLNLFDPATGTAEAFFHDSGDRTSLGANLVRAVYVDRNNTLWAGTNEGLHRFDRARKTFERFSTTPGAASSGLSHDLVDEILEDRSGRLWIGTGGGLDLFDRETETFEHFLADPRDPLSLSGEHVSAIVADRSDNLWIGTRTGGVDKLDLKPAKFRHVGHRFDDPNSLSAGWVFAFAQDDEGRLWVATRSALERYDKDTGAFVHFRHDPGDPRSLPNGQARDVLVDHRGGLWVTSWRGGLSRYVSDREGFVHYRHDPNDPASLVSDVVESLYEDRSGTLWVGTRSGLDRFDREAASFEHFRHDPGDENSLSDDYTQALYEDPERYLWVGTNSGGLNRFDPKHGIFERFQSDPGDPSTLSSDRVHAICNDTSGTLWVGTANGLNELLPDGTFRRYFEKDGLPNNRISGLLPDAEGHLWLSTFGGLSRFHPESGSFRNYTAHDGVPPQPFIRGSHFEDLRGRMYFGAENGFVVFDPKQIVDNPHVPPVVLTSIRLFDRPMKLDGAVSELRQIELTWQDDVVTFEFAALDYSSPRDNRYRFKLEGFDRGWSEVTSHREARYTGLDPGPYVFKVQGSNNDEVWNAEGASIAITVRAPPWRTGWAYAFYVLALSAVVLGFVRSQRKKVERERAINRRLRELDRLKDEFLANTSHELRTPLYGITGIAESLVDGARGELPRPVAADLSMIVSSGRRLATLVGDILDLSQLKHHSLTLDPAPVDLRSLTEVVLALSRPLVSSKNLELDNAVAPDLPPVEADENRLQQILHNLVANAVKFTESGKVEVSAELAHEAVEIERLVVSVSDTGPGISKELQDRIFEPFEQADAATDREYGGTGLGLAVTRQLVELHGGRIWVESAPGEGSRFSFSLPVSSRQPAEPAAPAPAVRTLAIEDAEASPPLGETDGAPVEADARILIVDDEPINLQVLRNYLSTQRLDVTAATSGEEALRMLGTSRFDLVLLDVMMPRMSGYEVCRVLRESYPIEQLPVIFLTAKNQAKDAVEGLALGANDYLMKPISKNELIARIRPHLDLVHIYRHLGDLVEEKMSQVKMLRGLLPICASCKKIRDDEGYWSEVEMFIDRHSEAQFTHGICPDCFEQYCSELEDAEQQPYPGD